MEDGRKTRTRPCCGKDTIAALSVALAVTALALCAVACTNPLAGSAATARAAAASPSIGVRSADDSSLTSGGALGFGDVTVGISRDLSLTILNTGKKALAIDTAAIALTPEASTGSGVFSVSSLPEGIVPVAGSTTLSLRFTPDAVGPKSAALVIPTNDVQNPTFTVAVSGSGWLVGLETAGVSSITWTTASGGGSVVDEGGVPVTERGLCWSTSQNPTVSDARYVDGGSGAGSYTGTLGGLKPGTYYYCRAYASNGHSVGYGPSVGFTTAAATAPATAAPSAINATTAVAGGETTADPGVTIGAYGVCWNTAGSPTVADSHTSDGSGAATFASGLSGLSPATTYYVRAYASNQGNTVYGEQVSLRTVGYAEGNGFYVFYDAGSVQTDATSGDWRYMIAAPSDMGTSNWSKTDPAEIGTAQGIGAGSANTSKVVTALTTNSVSALACVDATFGSFNDWFLPSKDELNLMIVNLALQGRGGFNLNTNYFYWSSSESNRYQVFTQLASSTATGGTKLKVSHSSGLTRAARRVTVLP